MAKVVSSLTRVASSWLDEAGELMDRLELPDIVQQWKTHRGSQQNVVWVWLCSSGGHFLGLQHLAFLQGVGGSRESSSRFHIGGGRFQ